MRFLSSILLFAAYVLIYSAVAAGGKFATEPWAALFADAYMTPDSGPTPPGQQGSPTASSPGLSPGQARTISRDYTFAG